MTSAATGTHVASLAELTEFVGRPLGVSSWITATQDRIDTFADATDDHQWIHVDPPDRAAKNSPFGGPIAHGYLTLSLIIPMWYEVLKVDSVTLAVNYGLNKVRFTTPVPAGARVRLDATLESLEELPRGGGVQIVVAGGNIELENSARPAVVVEAIYRLYD